jgi:hypothetical protein
MKHRNRRSLSIVAASLGGLLLLGLLSACSGGSGGSKTPEATATASPEPSSLTDLDRFHYIATLSLHGSKPDGSANDVAVTTEGDFQKPDRHAFTYTTQLPGAATKQSAVVIGDKIWIRNGDDPWHQATPDDPQAERLLGVTFSPINPGFLGGPEFREARDSVRRLPATLEFVNELRAYHYVVGPEGMQYFQQFLVQDPVTLDLQDMKWDVWLAQDGAWPVRLQATGTVKNDLPILQQLDLKAPTDWALRIDISRPNDPAISVEAPQ